MYEALIKTDKFLAPKENKHNSGFGEDMAKFYAQILAGTDKYIVSNVLAEDTGYGFWINIKKERFWFAVELADAPTKTWKIKLKPIGMASVTFVVMGKTFRGERIVSDIEEISDALTTGNFD